MLYFDHCASTPPYPEVIDTLAEVMKAHYANPSSIHRAGAEADKLIGRSRGLLGELFGVKPEEWLFTSGGTESNNTAIKGVAKQYRTRGTHLITTQIEHASVYDTFRQLEREGFKVTYLPVSRTGHVDVEQLRQAMTDETILVSVMHVNNETGAVQPVEAIGRMLKASYPRTIFHVDAVQSIGKLPISLKDWGIDLLSGSAHKVRGPKGVGILYVREGIQLYPLLTGGSQERSFRAGTQNVPGIVASAKALRLSMQSASQRKERMEKLRGKLVEIVNAIPELRMNGSENREEMAPHIVHFSYPGMKPEVIVHLLEEQQIIASTKSACSSKDSKPSRVLLAMGAALPQASGGIRISFGDEHTERDVETLGEALKQMVDKLKPLERGMTTSHELR
ncbi:cysteine desulfurase family protein [Paenibacillus radicis (ex Gao et al. 2016)]|uniref:Aminotransferase V n=1 Tax=Paenibacillus radicis (ex Gao et al. 2016) TaxID=1737354 RepID=A0A917MCW4_9BACL|nr:cysteine desulfurase family protein [Paenibacillus radicis (ex Gao et al. 2016)]GGG89133.1 aminotransferase V [Paenibacillus radicis (ex Gao et al. 2016)]